MKNQSKILWFLIGSLLIATFSLVYSSRKLTELERFETPQVAPIPSQAPAVQAASPNAVVVEPPKGEAIPKVATQPIQVPQIDPHCVTDENYLHARSDLGKIVGDAETRENNIPLFLKRVNDFKSEHGLPLPVGLDPKKAQELKLVFNKCHPSCKGMVYQTFVDRVMGQKIVLLTQEGKLSSFSLVESGVQLSTVDELGKSGVPFRTWRVPVIEEDWYLKGNDLFYKLDIENLWLRISIKGDWTVVAKPEGVERLIHADTSVPIPGCNPDEQCLRAGEGKQTRFFKAPQVCAPVLK